MKNWMDDPDALKQGDPRLDGSKALLRDGGETRHSARGMSLRALVGWLEAEHIAYTLSAVPGAGYVLSTAGLKPNPTVMTMTVELGSTRVVVQISARQPLEAAASEEIHDLVERIAQLACPDHN